MPDEDGSLHAPGAILMKGVLTESLVSPANLIPDYFCLFGMTPEFRPASVSCLIAENVCPLRCKKANWLLLRSFYALL